MLNFRVPIASFLVAIDVLQQLENLDHRIAVKGKG